jgi:TRAP-type C4-dicarboxylate transport system substrate-binding protein
MKSISAFFVLLIFGLLLWGCSEKKNETSSPQAAEVEQIKLTYANFPPASTFPSIQMERWKEEVEKRTDGRITVDTFPGSTLLGAKDMLQGVIDGQADIGCLCMSYQPGVFPLTTVTELPLGFTSSTVASKVLWDLYQKYQPAEFAKVKVLTMFTSAPSNIMSKKPVRSLADLQGLELRASGIASQILSRIGAVPVSMPMSQTPEALQKGIVNGLLSSFEVLKDLNFAEDCRYETITDFQVYPFAVVMNLDKYNSLPAEVKAVFDRLAPEQAAWTGQYMDAHVRDSLAWARDKYQIEVIDLPEADAAKARELVQPLVEEWRKKAIEAGVEGDALLEDLKIFQARHQSGA